jgi:hypothetical protein
MTIPLEQELLQLAEDKLELLKEAVRRMEVTVNNQRARVEKISGRKNVRVSSRNGRGRIEVLNPKMRMKDALLAYLTTVAKPVPLQTIVEDFLKAGVKMAKKPQRRAHNLKITIANNKETFLYLDDQDTVELKR